MASMSGSLLCLDEYCNAYGKNGLTYAMRVVKKNRELYKRYLANNSIPLNEEQRKQIEVLSILENLGFPMDEVGTHYYKDVIISICNDIKNGKSENIMSDLNNMYSNYYHMIARDEYDMGLTAFNAYINGAIERIDHTKADEELVIRIFGYNLDDVGAFIYDANRTKTFGKEAYCIASYIIESIKIKKLSRIEYK